MRFCQRPGRACTLCDVDAKKAAAFLPDFRDLDVRHLHEIAARPFTGEK